MTDVRSVPEGFHTITPHLVVKGAAAAIEFYKEAFGAGVSEISTLPGTEDVVLHATIVVNGSSVMINDEMPDFGVFGPGEHTAVTIHIYCDDVDAWYGRATAAGCEVVMPIADMPWGDRYAILKCPYGHRWSMATHTDDVTPAEIERRMQSEFGGAAS